MFARIFSLLAILGAVTSFTFSGSRFAAKVIATAACNLCRWNFFTATYLLNLPPNTNIIPPTNQQSQSSLQMANIVETAVSAGTFKTLVGELMDWNEMESRTFDFRSFDFY